jgi:uncharacterized caspase-like protein
LIGYSATSSVWPCSYLISVGVNSFENPAWNLQFAANDARLTQQVLFDKLSEQKYAFDAIVQVPLISDAQANENRATKANFKTVLDLLSGKPVDPERIKEIPNAAKIKQAAPGDLVVISFSSHGYADRNGSFYLFPTDSGKDARDKISDQMKEKLISSEELSLWLRDVDAGEMVMIVDACHAAAAVAGNQFKPGPMGSRGLGQLSYDKGMRIVAATQADRAAIEVGGALAHGLLSYALFKEGLEGGKANFKPGDEKQLTVRELLEYGVQRVPQLYRDVLNGNLKAVSKDVFIDEVSQSSGYSQQPSLFDFARRTDFTLIYLRP